MTMARGTVLALAVCAALLAAGAADAKSSKKNKAKAAAVVTAPAAPTPAGAGESFLLKNFDAIDTDHNQQLSRDEISAWAAATREQFRQRAAERITAADTNGDGQISLEEARAGLPGVYEHFDFLDANDDGQISRAEFERLRDPAALRAEVLARLKAADKDGNGKLDLAETQVAFPRIAARFSQLDQDGDGYLTGDEIARLLGPH